MRIYQKNNNKTAAEIAEKIKRSEFFGFKEKISAEAYKWLYMHAGSLASLVEELLDGKYYVSIGRNKEYGEYEIQVEWREIDTSN